MNTCLIRKLVRLDMTNEDTELFILLVQIHENLFVLVGEIKGETERRTLYAVASAIQNDRQLPT